MRDQVKVQSLIHSTTVGLAPDHKPRLRRDVNRLPLYSPRTPVAWGQRVSDHPPCFTKRTVMFSETWWYVLRRLAGRPEIQPSSIISYSWSCDLSLQSQVSGFGTAVGSYCEPVSGPITYIEVDRMHEWQQQNKSKLEKIAWLRFLDTNDDTVLNHSQSRWSIEHASKTTLNV